MQLVLRGQHISRRERRAGLEAHLPVPRDQQAWSWGSVLGALPSGPPLDWDPLDLGGPAVSWPLPHVARDLGVSLAPFSALSHGEGR